MWKTKNWYVIQTISGKEEKVKEKLEKLKLENTILFLPMRRMLIRRKGQFKWELKSLFPGYFFINTIWKPEKIKAVKLITGVTKVLKSFNSPTEVPEREMQLIFSLVNKDNIIPESKAILVGDRVQIVGGPLKSLVGEIVSVDKRKKRVKVRLMFLGTYKDVYFSYELVEKV